MILKKQSESAPSEASISLRIQEFKESKTFRYLRDLKSNFDDLEIKENEQSDQEE